MADNGMRELGTTYTKVMMDNLLMVHTCMSMYRVSSNEEYRKTAASWFPELERNLANLKHELTKEQANG